MGRPPAGPALEAQPAPGLAGARARRRRRSCSSTGRCSSCSPRRGGASTAGWPQLGPDILAEDFDERAYLRRLREDDPTRPIGDALLDQRTLAGIGNLWKVEACFGTAIDPWRPHRGGRRRRGAGARPLGPPADAGVGARPAARTRSAWSTGPRGRPCPRCGDDRAPARAWATTTARPPGAPDASGEARRPQGGPPHRARQHAGQLRRRAGRRRRHDRVRRAARARRRPPAARPRPRGRAAARRAHARGGPGPPARRALRRRRARRRPQGDRLRGPRARRAARARPRWAAR